MSDEMWMKIEFTALDDWRIVELSHATGESHGDALLRCLRVWRRLYERGGRPIPESELDAVAGRVGYGAAMVSASLASMQEAGLLPSGSDRAVKFGEFREKQRQNAAVRYESCGMDDKTPATGTANGSASLDLSLRSGSGSGSPDARSQVHLRLVPAEPHPSRDPRAVAEAWVAWFNELFGRRMTASKEVVALVKTLLARRYTLLDMKGVAMILREQWQDDEEMRRHLVPMTILRSRRFAERLDEAKERWPHKWLKGDGNAA